MNKLAFVAAASLALAASAQPAGAQTLKDALNALRLKWNAPTEPFRMIGNIHYVGTDGLASYLVTGPDGHVLIDTVLPEGTGQIKANIVKLGFKLADIKLILNTHGHFDHTGGLAEMKADTGAQLVVGAADKPLIEGGYYPGQETETELAFPPVKVDRTVADGDVVSVGRVSLTAHATPGHSPGCTTWTTKVQEAGQEHGVVFFCSGTVALNRLVTNPTHPGIADDYRSTFERAPRIAGDVLLAPHPEMYGMAAKRARLADGGPNPFVVPGEFQAYLAKLRGEFEASLAKQQAAAAAAAGTPK